MAITYSLNQQMVAGTGGTVSNSLTASAASEVVLDAETVPIATDTLMNIAFPYATIQAYVLLSTVDCTIETNAINAAGGQTITLLAGVPKLWISGGDGSNIFSANVTKIYVTSAAAGTLTMRVLYDPTP